MAEVVRFLYFRRLPQEIQGLIWKHSLPGPRTICPGHFIRDAASFGSDFDKSVFEVRGTKIMENEDTLFFPKNLQAASPMALRICRSSRATALRTYHLAFGTKNIYVNWEMDILFFGPWFMEPIGRHSFLWAGWIRGDGTEVSKRPCVTEDLEKVQRLGLKYSDGWTTYDDGEGALGYYYQSILGVNDAERGGERLRRDVAKFKNVKELLLDNGINGIDEDDESTPGQVILDDFAGWEYDEDEGEDYDVYDNLPMERWSRIESQFMESSLRPEEKENGIPAIRLVSVRRVLG